MVKSSLNEEVIGVSLLNLLKRLCDLATLFFLSLFDCSYITKRLCGNHTGALWHPNQVQLMVGPGALFKFS